MSEASSNDNQQKVVFDHLLTSSDNPLTGSGSVSIQGSLVGSINLDARNASNATLAMPVLANAHDHGRGMRTLAFGALDDALEIWLTRLGLEPAVDPYLRALVALGRMAESGIGVINHCHNTADFKTLAAEASEVARAAHTVGVRLAFATPILGQNPIAYGDPAPLFDRLSDGEASRLKGNAAAMPSFADQLAVAEELFDLSDDLVTVQYGPIAPQWVDDSTLARIADRSAMRERRIHMHLFETKAQREWADAHYPDGLLNHLDTMGLLSERLTVAHGTYLTRTECELLAERGVYVSVNTSSNLRLRSGIAPVADFMATGVRFGMGMDGMAFDDDEDGLREMRLLWHLQRGFGFTDTLERADLLKAVLFTGRDAILGPGSAKPLDAGAPADLMLLDTAPMQRDVIPERVDLLDLLLTRATQDDVQDVWIAGRKIVAEGSLVGADLAAAETELTERVRRAAQEVDFASLDRIADAYRDYYRCGYHLELGDPQDIVATTGAALS
ncbi:MAG: amidohydrolase family protein [Pseudomonadota bacterium]